MNDFLHRVKLRDLMMGMNSDERRYGPTISDMADRFADNRSKRRRKS